MHRKVVAIIIWKKCNFVALFPLFFWCSTLFWTRANWLKDFKANLFEFLVFWFLAAAAMAMAKVVKLFIVFVKRSLPQHSKLWGWWIASFRGEMATFGREHQRWKTWTHKLGGGNQSRRTSTWKQEFQWNFWKTLLGSIKTVSVKWFLSE